MPRGVTPIVATHQLEIQYTVGTLAHVQQLRCNAVLSGSFYNLECFGGATRLASTCALEAGNLMATILPSSATVTNYILYVMSSGVRVPVESAAITVTPSSLGGLEPAWQTVFKIRDSGYNPMNYTVLGAAFSNLFHDTPAAAGSAYLNIANDLVNHSAGHVGFWLRGRSAEFTNNVQLVTLSPNRISRRRLGLV